MSLAEKIYQDVQNLSEDTQVEIIEFIEFVKFKEKRKRDKLMDNFIDDNMEALKELAK